MTPDANHFSWPCLRYVTTDANGKTTLSKPVVIESNTAAINRLFSVIPGDPYQNEERRAEIVAWMGERNMVAEFGNPWGDADGFWMRPDGRPTRSRIEYKWVFGFDTPEQAMEFKLRWL